MRKVFIISVLIVFLVSACASFRPHPRPWTTEEKIAAGYFLVAHFADYYTTERYLNNPDNWEAMNPALGEHPSDSKITIYFSLTAVGALIVGHFWPEARKPLFISYGSLNAGLAIYNSQLD